MWIPDSTATLVLIAANVFNSILYLKGREAVFLFSTDMESVPLHPYHVWVHYCQMTPNYLRSALISGLCPSEGREITWHTPLLSSSPSSQSLSLQLSWPFSYPSLSSLLSIVFPPFLFSLSSLLSSRLNVSSRSHDRSSMGWGTWGLLLMVTNDCGCTGGEGEGVAEKGATLHAGGQCLCSVCRYKRGGGDSLLMWLHVKAILINQQVSWIHLKLNHLLPDDFQCITKPQKLNSAA